jgi:hypothetical protein
VSPAVLIVAYGIATTVAYLSSDVPELLTELGCIAALAAFAVYRGGGRWFLVLVVPIPAFVLLHEQIPVDHWIAYGPAALSLAMAAWADRAWRKRPAAEAAGREARA